jgi:hypothetical protein
MTRDRGTYGPLDRDRHFVLGWGADRLAAHAQARAFDATIGPALPMIDIASRAGNAANRLWVGTQLMGGRDEAEKSVAVVGQEFFHTGSDRTRAIVTLSTSFQALANDLAVWHAAHMDAQNATALAQWLHADVTPTLEEWNLFAAREAGSWWRKVATSWGTFENWMLRLRQLRALARAHGVVLQSSEPPPLPKTVFQRSEEGSGSDGATILGVLKIGAAAAITIMGAIGVFAVTRELVRKKNEVIPAAAPAAAPNLRACRSSYVAR